MAKRIREHRSTPLLDIDDAGNTSATHPREKVVALHEAAQSRYLNYALSVITARALPDVRDGLKPVQRRILYTMWKQRLNHDSKPRKCAKVVGDVMGSYHPHGDTAIYDTLVRMAQPFSLRYPLIEGFGNFGSLDGDNAAAMRYTECRLENMSTEILSELDQQTVAFRANYDGTKTEPVILPSRLPNLLVNGATGIAVGMATNIPPHHLGEVCTALIKLLDNPELSSVHLAKYIKGPDFPTGGHILNTPSELKQIYKTGSGTIRIRATWEIGTVLRTSKTVFITSIPYATNKAQIVERIAEIVLERKLSPLLDVKDQSTDKLRIALELKPDAEERLVMAYLFKHTPLQSNFAVNLTCLVPTEQPEVSRPERLDLHQALWHFLHFRLEIVTCRLTHDLAMLKKRIHILKGFKKIFNALDAVIKLIRKSDGKADAAKQIVRKFNLDEEQVDAILELKIYRLARLEILIVQKELTEKQKRVHQISVLLKNEEKRWKIVRDEIKKIQQLYGNPKLNPRRTQIESNEDEMEYRADDFIVEEDNIIIVSRDGWIKRQKEVRNLSSTRLRDGDELLAALAGSTRATCVFFSNFGIAYTCRLIDVPASSGHGAPIQQLFKLKDGEQITAAISLDPRITPNIASLKGDKVPSTHAIAVTSDGYALRFSFEPFTEPSTRTGRRFARPTQGAKIVGVKTVHGSEIIIAATNQARAILCDINEINLLSGPGKGVMLFKLKKDQDHVLGFIASRGDRDLLKVETSRGASQTISTAKYGISSRGGKGRQLLQRGQFLRIVQPTVELPIL